LLSGSITFVIKGIYIFLSGDHRYIKVFKLLAYLGIRAHLAVLLKGLYYYNLSLSEGPFYLNVTVFYKVSLEFLFKLLRSFKRGKVDINKRCK